MLNANQIAIIMLILNLGGASYSEMVEHSGPELSGSRWGSTYDRELGNLWVEGMLDDRCGKYYVNMRGCRALGAGR